MAQLKTNFKGEETNEYKVVQVEIDSIQYLWFTSISRDHANCLASLLEREGNRFGLYSKYPKPFKMSEDRMAREDELATIKTYKTVHEPCVGEVPALEGDGYKVLGMGRAYVDARTKTAKFLGKSQGYNIRISREQLASLEKLIPDWAVKSLDD